MAQPTYLTAEGLSKLKSELEALIAQRRPAVALRIQKAKEIGGTVDEVPGTELRLAPRAGVADGMKQRRGVHNSG